MNCCMCCHELEEGATLVDVLASNICEDCDTSQVLGLGLSNLDIHKVNYQIQRNGQLYQAVSVYSKDYQESCSRSYIIWRRKIFYLYV
jgi:hypothetical protein